MVVSPSEMLQSACLKSVIYDKKISFWQISNAGTLSWKDSHLCFEIKQTKPSGPFTEDDHVYKQPVSLSTSAYSCVTPSILYLQ